MAPPDPAAVNNPIMIAVLGVTGTGKSTFIERVTGLPTGIGHGITSETKLVKIYKTVLGGKEVWFLDTPGFDDTYVRDTDVLKEINSALAEQHLAGRKMNGVVYLHNILDGRMRGSSLTNLYMMLKLVGKDARLRNLIFVTTMWDRLADKAEGIKTENMFKAKFWNEMIAYGASVARIEDHNDRNAYMHIVKQLMDNNGITLQIQEETVDQQLPLGETSAEKAILDQVNKLSEKWQQDIAELNEELRLTREGADNQAKQMQNLLNRQVKELQEELRLAAEDRKNLRTTITDLAKDNKDLARLLDQLTISNGREEEKQTKARPPPPAGAPSPKQTTGLVTPQSATTSFNSTLHITLQEINELDRHWYHFCAVAFSPDNKFLVTGDSQGSIRLWDAANGSPLRWTNLSGQNFAASSVNSLAFSSPDGSSVWVTDSQARVWNWNLRPKPGANPAYCEHLREFAAKDFALSPDGKLLAGAGQIWYLPTRARLGNFEGTGPVAFSPDSNLIASISWAANASYKNCNIIGIWDTKDCTKKKEKLVHSAAITSIQFSPDGKRIASGSADQTIRFWEWAGTDLQGIIGEASIDCIAYSPNGRLLAAASHGTSKIWIFDMVSRSQRAEFQGYYLARCGIAFSPDSTLFAATVNEPDSRNNYRVKIWRLSYL